jgi:hypothetical protein
MPLEVMPTTTSVGCSILGSGTVSTRTSRRPCQVTAFMGSSSRMPKTGCLGYPVVYEATPGSAAGHGVR